VSDKPTTAISHTAANAPTVAKSGRSPNLLASTMAPAAVAEVLLARDAYERPGMAPVVLAPVKLAPVELRKPE
jgi:hypothetical protein